MFSALGWALAEITTNIAAPEHFWSFLDKIRPTFVQILPGPHVQNLGVLIFWRIFRRRPPGLGTQGVTVRPIRHLGLFEEWPG